MIRRLRAWHRAWFAVLAILLPVLLVFALRNRPQVPRVEALPGASDLEPRAGEPDPAERPRP